MVSLIFLLDKLLLTITGIFTILWVILYLFAIRIEKISNIVPIFLTIPIFGYIFGYLFLGEDLLFFSKNRFSNYIVWSYFIVF